jgi:hypothetical protein
MVENMYPNDRLPYPIHIFYSYAQEDESLLKELEKHLSALKRQGYINAWDKRNISAGREWLYEVNNNLNTADIVLLIVSADFLASEYHHGIEMQQALARHEANNARVIPIILRPVDWTGEPFSHLQALPTGSKPVIGRAWHNQDEAFTDIAQGIRKVVDELRTSRPKERSPQSPSTLIEDALTNPEDKQLDPQDKSTIIPLRSSVFHFNQPLSDSKEFYGRARERQTLLNRTSNKGSTSIVGPRRMGKTWLMHYIRLIAPQELGSRYLVGYLDATASRCSTVAGFVATTLQALTLQNLPFATGQDSLILLEQVLEDVFSAGKVPVLCIDEFEYFSYHSEFDLDFFSSLRAMTQKGLCLLVASKLPLIDIVESWKTSPFFNVFKQITLKPFDQKEAEHFLREKGARAGLTTQEREKLLLYGQYKGAYWPISLQLAGETLIEDKTLAQREHDPDYYRPADQDYWKEFEYRLQEIYGGMMK